MPILGCRAIGKKYIYTDIWFCLLFYMGVKLGLGEKHRLRVVFGPKREEVTGN
jgi:hypothetical protein